MTTKKEAETAAADLPDYPEPSSSPNVDGAHDLSDHPGVLSGTLRNTGDTVRSRPPSAASFRRPQMIRQEVGERSTTTSDPAKKTARSTGKSDGAGPES